MDIQEYITQMEDVSAKAIVTVQTARRRLALRDEMKGLSEEQEDPDIAMDAVQKAALVADQLALTELIDAPLAAAKAALQ